MQRIAFVLFWLATAGFGCKAGDCNKSDEISLLDLVERGTPGVDDASDERPAHEFLTFSGERREVITFPVDSKLSVLLEIRPGTVLEFSLALLSRIGRDDGIEFRVYVEAGGKRVRAFSEVLTSDALERWRLRRADLTGWDDEAATLILETRWANGTSRTSPAVVGFAAPEFKTDIHREAASRGVSLFNEWSRVVGAPGAVEPRDVSDTKFSHDRGFYDHAFELTITTATPDSTVVYTTDGSSPSLGNGKLGNTLFISRTTVVRARAFKDGMTPTNVDTQTYIFPNSVREQKTLPYDYPAPPPEGVSSGATAFAPRPDLDMEIDPDIVSSDHNEEFVDGLTSIPTLSLVMDSEHLFDSERGLYFEHFPPVRAGSVELIYPPRERFSYFEGFQIDCAVKAHSQMGGVQTKGIQKRSLRLIFSREYGPGKLRYPLFESAVHHAESATSEFDTIVLRAGGQANWSQDNAPVSENAVYVRDQHLRDSQLWLSGLSAHGIFVHLYLNGMYWGVYNAVERPDQRFLASYLGGEPYADWIAVNQYGPLGDPPRSSRWEDLHAFARTRGLSEPENYEHMKSLLDTSQFSDYILLNWFSGMSDWGKNNWYAGVRVNPPGRCIYFCWDSEMTYGLVREYGAPGAWVDPAFVNPAKPSAMHRLWQSLEDSPEFLLLFADRVYRACYNGGPLSDNVNQANFRRLSDYVEKAMLCESARWGDSATALADDPRTKDGHWVRARDDVLSQMEGNASRFIQVLREHGYYPTIDPPTFERAGEQLVIARPDGADEVFFTTDGSDPRSVDANRFTESTRSVPFSAQLRARARRGSEWSALHEYGVWKEP